MLISIKELKQLIKNSVDTIKTTFKPYEKELIDDTSYKEKSVYVPDDIKDPINKWMKMMGLSNKKH